MEKKQDAPARNDGYDPEGAWTIQGLLEHMKLAEVVFIEDYRPEERPDVAA